MLPEYEEVTINTNALPSKTFPIGSSGYIDQIEAVKQAVSIILDVNRFDNPTVSWNFGNELNQLIGQPMELVIPESERYIREALTQDDRINDVVDFEFTEQGSKLLANYRVVTIYGDFTQESEVNI